MFQIENSRLGTAAGKYHSHMDRPEYWTNPLMNRQLSNGRIECTHGGLVNEVHSLTHQLVEGDGEFRIEARVGRMPRQGTFPGNVVFAGFVFGTVGHRNDYRSNIYYDIESGFAEELMKEPPLQADITTAGHLVINSEISEKALLTPTDLEEYPPRIKSEQLRKSSPKLKNSS